MWSGTCISLTISTQCGRSSLHKVMTASTRFGVLFFLESVTLGELKFDRTHHRCCVMHSVVVPRTVVFGDS